MTEIAPGNIDFAQTIAEHKESEYVPSEQISFMAGEATVTIRERGAFIVTCSLEDPSTGRARRVLYCAETGKDLFVPKITASHTMLPVGPSDGIGGQHGFPRWADYELVGSERGDASTRVVMQAEQSAHHVLSLTREFELHKSTFASLSEARNNSNTVQQTSLGEHYYFDLPNSDVAGIRFDGASLDEVLGEGAIEGINRGEAQFLSYGTQGVCAIIGFSDGKTVRLEGHAVLEVGAVPIEHGLLVWRRPGSPSICFEPTIGYNQKANNGIDIPPRGSVGLITTVDLVV